MLLVYKLINVYLKQYWEILINKINNKNMLTYYVFVI